MTSLSGTQVPSPLMQSCESQSLLTAQARQVPSGLQVGVAVGQSALTLHAAQRPMLVPLSLQCGVAAERWAQVASSPAPLQARHIVAVVSHTGKLAGQVVLTVHIGGGVRST